MRKKREKLFSKILLLFLTVMIVLGFTVPGFMDSGNEPQQYEPKICQTDTDCYLMCGEDGDEPVSVLCSQNMCSQNTCQEGNYYPYSSEAVNFELFVEKEGVSVNLVGDEKNIFVKFNGNAVSLFSSGLSLGHVLEKVGMKIDSDSANVSVNDEQNYAYSEFVPEEGDKVRVIYE